MTAEKERSTKVNFKNESQNGSLILNQSLHAGFCIGAWFWAIGALIFITCSSSFHMMKIESIYKNHGFWVEFHFSPGFPYQKIDPKDISS